MMKTLSPKVSAQGSVVLNSLQNHIVRKCHESALRVLVNLSHDNETWSGALLDNELTIPMVARLIISSHHQISGVKSYEGKIHVSDRLCLALGLLTNLVQVDERAKDLIRETCTFEGV